METFRSRWIVAVIFAALSFGQAYPFAVAWGMDNKTHPCCCSSEVAKPCDCDHSGRSKKFSCHSERLFGYSAAPCGGQTENPSLNFRGELCLPRFTRLIFHFEQVAKAIPEKIHWTDFHPLPESPPPKA